MSGRVRVTLSDGRRVTGFRKTLRRNPRAPRTPHHQLPTWQASFLLPDDMRFFGVAPGRPVIGVEVRQVGSALHVEATGKNREWVLRQVVTFLRQAAPDWTGTLPMTVICGEDQGGTLSGPITPAKQFAYRLALARHEAHVLQGNSMRPLVIADGGRNSVFR